MITIKDVLFNLLHGLSQIKDSFVRDLSILWLIAPVILFWMVMEIYLDRYKKEELGWNTALGNGLSVFWVTLTCLKFLFDNHFKNFNLVKLIGVVVIFLYGALVIINSFSHKLKKNISFLLASPTPTYFLSLVAILWTYGRLNIDLWIIIDFIILYLIVGLIEILLKKLIKPAKEEMN